MLKLLFYIFIGWLLYKLVFDFILPIYSSTKQIRRQMNDVQDRMHQAYREQQQQQQQQYYNNQAQQQSSNPSKPNSEKGDYIDFEEVK
ncbi:hypothetical protein COR50_04480 [Chitinophaga caeni]|uniref:DUF4834 domain-containing protein n=1 Tax=Chitinophaga caeni TaxID=2029983 RepID=A0A291QRA5_9BACT|nr:DUF4834 family protein [Chitinophaga caeni]ATL46490.1 hypothetical protein COR50_04480 [Chitinophaga caeni]